MDSFIQTNGTRIPYTIERRKRKTVGISISAEKGVIIAAPGWISKAHLHSILMEKASWIESKLELALKKKKAIYMPNFLDGDNLPYQGCRYLLKLKYVINIRYPSVDFTKDGFVVTLPGAELPAELQKDVIRKTLIDWYKKQAFKVICERVAFYGKIMKVAPLKIAVRDQKTIWGSCSGKNSLNINWRLILAPIEVLDYVLVHELSHIEHKNHSKTFWNLVGSIIPEYKTLSLWLKQNGEKLII